ncbi:MAG: glycine zipper 2TM domain-containing protein [Gammaproteobacteria bacterium]|jgi:uncharacterized protein YcfJ
MRKGLTIMIAAGLAAPFASQASADSSSYYADAPTSYYITAPVIAVDPIRTTKTVEHPVRQCTSTSRERIYRHEYERRDSDRSYFLPGLFGGMVGGLIGNQFGGGNGKKVLTVVGALAGSSIARDAARQRDREAYPTRVCTTTYDTEVIEEISAYDVTYEYGGRQFTKRTSERPGESVRVRVEVSPAADDV